MQRTISWVLCLALTIIISGYGVCLLERGAHRLLKAGGPAMMHTPGGPMDHPGGPMPDSAGHPMMHPGCCMDSTHRMGACGDMKGCDEHMKMGCCDGRMGCGDGRMGCGGHMGCCDGHMRMRPFGPPPMVGHAFTAMLGALVLIAGLVFGMVTLRVRPEKAAS